MSLLILIAAVMCGCAVAIPSQAPAVPGQGRIDLVRGETTTITALFDGAAAGALTYRLEVVREGPAGRSQSAQGGAFESAAGRTDTLSTVRISTASGDHLDVHLVVRRGDVIVSDTHIDETVP